MEYKKTLDLFGFYRIKNHIFEDNESTNVIQFNDLDPEYCCPDDPKIVIEQLDIFLNNIEQMKKTTDDGGIIYDYSDKSQILNMLYFFQGIFQNRELYDDKFVHSKEDTYIPFFNFVLCNFTDDLDITESIIKTIYYLFYRDISNKAASLLYDFDIILQGFKKQPEIQFICFDCLRNCLLDPMASHYFYNLKIINAVINVIISSDIHSIILKGLDFLNVYVKKCFNSKEFEMNISVKILEDILEFTVGFIYKTFKVQIASKAILNNNEICRNRAVLILVELIRKEYFLQIALDKYYLEYLTKELLDNYCKNTIRCIFELIGNITSFRNGNSIIFKNNMFFPKLLEMLKVMKRESRIFGINCLIILTKYYSNDIFESGIFEFVIDQFLVYGFDESRCISYFYLSFLSEISVPFRRKLVNDVSIEIISRLLETETEIDFNSTSNFLLKFINDDQEFWQPIFMENFSDYYLKAANNGLTLSNESNTLLNYLIN